MKTTPADLQRTKLPFHAPGVGPTRPIPRSSSSNIMTERVSLETHRSGSTFRNRKRGFFEESLADPNELTLSIFFFHFPSLLTTPECLG